MRTDGRRRTVLFLAAGLVMGPTLLYAAPPIPGNLIASVNEFTGSSTAPTYVAEYTTSGTRLQILADIPEPGGTGVNTDTARDLILGPGNAIHVYNGTFDPYLARLDLNTLDWTQRTYTGWSTVANMTYGGLDQLGPYIFATDMWTGGTGDAPRGVVRFDTTGGATVRFAETIEPIDLVVGPDGVLYALSSWSVHKYDPLTFASLGSVTLGSSTGVRAIDVATDGSIVAATSEGDIHRYSAAGVLMDSLSVPGAFFGDIDVDPNGNIALGTAGEGEIVITDLTLDGHTSFLATDSTSGGWIFVAWVPEPSALGLLALGALAALWRPDHRR